MQAGTITSLLFAPSIIENFSWPAVFYIFGSLGFVWLLGWIPIVKDNYYVTSPSSSLPSGIDSKLPQSSVDHASESSERWASLNDTQRPVVISDDEASVASSSARVETGRAQDFPWRQVLSSRPFWAIFWAHSAFGFGHHMVCAWLPTYYFQEYGLDVKNSAWLSALPYVLMIACTTFGGWSSDNLIKREYMSRVTARKTAQLIAGIAPAGCLLYLAAASNHDTPELSLASAVGIMTAMMGLGGFCGAGFGSNHQDLTKKYPGILFGITSASSSAFGCVSTYATGVLLDMTHSWAIVFEAVALVYIGTTAMYVAWASADNQFDGPPALSSGRQVEVEL